MSARECRCVHCRPKEPGEIMGPWRAEDNCYSCDGTGKVHPSVEGEIVVEQEADCFMHSGVPGNNYLDLGCFHVPGPGRYRAIVQKVGE